MHLFFVDKNLVVTKRLDRGYLMQYSDGVDMVFFAMDGADANKPKNQTAHLYGQTLDTKMPLILMMDWTKFEYGGKDLWGWCTTIPSTFTQVAGTIYLNCVITEITNLSTNEGVEHIISTCEILVNDSAGESAWTNAINYAQWKELVSYFINTYQWEDYVTLATNQTITGSKTFTRAIRVSNNDALAIYNSGSITKSGVGTYTFPTKSGIFALVSDVGSALNEAKGYTTTWFNKCVTLAGNQKITGEKTFENDIKVTDTNTTLVLKTNGIQTGSNVFTFPVKADGDYVFAMTSDVSTCLETAKSYTDEKVSAEASSRATGDTNTLTEAKKYTDEQIAGIDHSKYVTVDTQQTISAKKIFTAEQTFLKDISLNFGISINDGVGNRLVGSTKETTYTTTYWVEIGSAKSKLRFSGTADRPLYNGTDMALSTDIKITATDYAI